MNLLKKVQNQPEPVRKVIFWTIVIIISLCLLFLWAKNAQERFESLKQRGLRGELKLPDLSIDKELPFISPAPDDLDSLEDILKQIEKEIEESEAVIEDSGLHEPN